MKLIRLIIFCVFISIFQVSFSQSTALFEDSFTENTTDHDKFRIYLDSIDAYMYRDVDKTQLALTKCQDLINKGTLLGDSTLFSYVLSKIYFEYSKASPLGAFQLIVDNKKILKSKEISKKQLGNFSYIESFTYMSMGDLEAAQKAYYEGIELGKANMDTSSVIRNMYSLGQLLNDEQYYDDAIYYFTQVIDYSKTHQIRPSTLALNYMELSETYTNKKEYDKSLAALQSAFEVLEKHQLEILKSDVMLFKGNVFLAQGKLDLADDIHEQLLKLNQGSQDKNNIFNTRKFEAQLYRAKKMYPQTLNIYEELIAKTDSSNLDDLMATYKNAHELCRETGDYKAAHDYLFAYNKLKNKKEEDSKRQRTAYLKIKYDSEQKEKDNEILVSQISKSQAERKLLYGWTALSCLFLIALFGAFYQRIRYSKKLEGEVLKRTLKLENSVELLNKSNMEMEEFNRILSHDLKEPLRSIVGFSQLAIRDITKTTKAQEHLNFVIKGGKQLEQLIEDVGLYRQTYSINTKEKDSINMQSLLLEAAKKVEEEHPQKQIELIYNTKPIIYGPRKALAHIFRIIIQNATIYNKEKKVLININYQLKDQMHLFEIEDNGIGISPKYHGQIFEMFKRLNHRSQFKGSGLGLSIAQRLIEKMDGKISILRSEENKGSTFLISFPQMINAPVERVASPSF